MKRDPENSLHNGMVSIAFPKLRTALINLGGVYGCSQSNGVITIFSKPNARSLRAKLQRIKAVSSGEVYAKIGRNWKWRSIKICGLSIVGSATLTSPHGFSNPC